MTTYDTSLFRLDGLQACVIGGTGTLGGEFARALAGLGARVAVCGRSRPRGEAAVDGIRQAGGVADFVELDVTSRESLKAAAVRLAPDGRLDILVNAAGVNSSVAFDELSDQQWQQALDVNLSAVFRTCQQLRPLLQRSVAGASVINISSASASPPLSRVMAYGVAKAGLNNLTQYLAREFALEGTRVNAIVPGFFPAEQNRELLSEERIAAIKNHTPMRRLGDAHELAGALIWLASPAASGFVTGALIPVDGGFSAMTI
jgi:NAD(P)-dependent dehydrogenase (short-subunit alcohol dehydrogenase family)